KGNLIVGNNVRWTWPLQQGKSGEIMQVMAGFKGLEQDEIATVRKLFNKLPFTWVEGGTEGKDYFAFLDIPILTFHECVRFIETNLGAVRSKLEMSILDSAKTQYMSVPDEMFDKRLGWRLFGVDEVAKASAPAGEPRESRQVTEGEREPTP
ncbi:MAG: hypothetical protein OK442_03055, partial [Thaumarchaeota archaeon]|nr:hypothetical protein [Nitrososphaerota archaeon]